MSFEGSLVSFAVATYARTNNYIKVNTLTNNTTIAQKGTKTRETIHHNPPERQDLNKSNRTVFPTNIICVKQPWPKHSYLTNFVAAQTWQESGTLKTVSLRFSFLLAPIQFVHHISDENMTTELLCERGNQTNSLLD